MTIEPRHFRIRRRVRYAVLDGDPDRLAQVWFVLHGYNQLAHRFLRHFRPIDDGTRHIVAAEGLHRHYIDHAARRVGASWMTSEDRLTDIADYVGYLDALYSHVLDEVDPSRELRVFALGFSQGVHTLCRWLSHGDARVDRAVLWGATVPPDLDLGAHGGALGRSDLQLVVGDEDEHFGPTAVQAHEDRLRSAAVRFRSWTFEGGHRLDAETLRGLAGS